MIIEKRKCIKECNNEDKYKYEYNKICYEQCPSNTIQNGSKCIEISKEDESILNFKKNIYNDEIILNITENGKDLIQKDENLSLIYQITTSENQKNAIYNNISSINIGKC